MSNSGGFVVTRIHSDSRFYNPPPVRRHRQQLLLQQRQQKQVRSEVALVYSAESEPALAGSDESALSVSRPSSVCSSSTQRSADLTHLDRLIESVTPSVRAHQLTEVRTRGGKTQEFDLQQYFSLGDLWEAFREWSVYGVGVPLVLNGSEPVKQYYVPSLSGIKLYIDAHRMRNSGYGSNAESRETSSCESSDCEAEKKGKGEEAWLVNSSGQLVFEYLEQDPAHFRKPLYDKRYRSCDLLPASWISIAWYPIYRIPVGLTLQNLDTSFLTFHRLSTPSRSMLVSLLQSHLGKVEPQLHVLDGRRIYGLDSSPKFSLPVFGLASYKLRGLILTPDSDDEWQQAKSLLQAVDNWLQHLQVNLPNYQFCLP